MRRHRDGDTEGLRDVFGVVLAIGIPLISAIVVVAFAALRDRRVR